MGASSKVFMLIHGDPGVGKTTLIGSGGGDFKTLIIRPPIDHADPIIGSGVQEMLVSNWEEIFDALDYLRHEGSEWDWVWIDSISLLQDIGLDDVYETAIDSKGGRSGARARFGPDRGEYRINMWRLEQFVRFAVGASIFNMGVTAHSFWFTDPELGNTQLMPWIQGRAMPQKICGMMNLVGYMEVVKREVRGQTRESRVLRVNKTDRYYAKCQFKTSAGDPVFDGGSIYNPTMPEIATALGRKPAGRRRGTRPAGRTRKGA